MIRCIIIEDEVLAQDVIKSHLQKIDRLELVGVYRNAPEAMDALRTMDVDLMFLDIHLPGMTGLHFLRTLSEPPLVILTTAYSEYALESYEFSVIDYLLKPISFERFVRAVNKVTEDRLFTAARKEKDRSPEDHIFIRSNSKFFRVNFSEIMYVQGMKDYLKIHTPDYVLVTHQTMNELEKLLPARQFIRVHKSYIAAIARIRSIYGNTVELEKAVLPIGISYKEKVMSLIERRP
ncbi:MAG: LytTR family DNA-binding domain-containing protein [Bacteroidota bacterium]|nr:LytTR family DNA-binding domain-containing protein [Bacteroidota bacterium]MDP4215945.1 LytTR family DNA-binding domain-containing protein [Bacteroidota bacterium]MDP4246689.1 LytTR family DNA-binding domain-containing protein [Bacteroidota bacterium]MDP4259214.1 LytTR family DNA-binding domain-containing protein [Bacteroidota bacterium]